MNHLDDASAALQQIFLRENLNLQPAEMAALQHRAVTGLAAHYGVDLNEPHVAGSLEGYTEQVIEHAGDIGGVDHAVRNLVPIIAVPEDRDLRVDRFFQWLGGPHDLWAVPADHYGQLEQADELYLEDDADESEIE